jgi:hypothetical protein
LFGGEEFIFVLPLLSVTWRDQGHMRLSDLIPEMLYREATRPEDKIFALLGLCDGNGHQYPEPDCSLSLEAVTLKYTRAMIQADGCLNVLDFVYNSDQKPTWALNLKRSIPLTTRIERDGEMSDQKTYNAASGLPLIMERASRVEDSTLVLRGRGYDRISRVCHL